MIQCDTCKCWQHGPCVGLYGEKVAKWLLLVVVSDADWFLLRRTVLIATFVKCVNLRGMDREGTFLCSLLAWPSCTHVSPAGLILLWIAFYARLTAPSHLPHLLQLQHMVAARVVLGRLQRPLGQQQPQQRPQPITRATTTTSNANQPIQPSFLPSYQPTLT